MSTVNADLRRFLASNFFVAEAQPLADTDSFLEHQVLDSTGFLELIAHLEETYRIKIDDREMLPENLDSLASIEAFLTRKGVA